MLFKGPTLRLSGRYRWFVLDENDEPSFGTFADGRRVSGIPWMPNLITDRGLDLLVDYSFMSLGGGDHRATMAARAGCG